MSQLYQGAPSPEARMLTCRLVEKFPLTSLQLGGVRRSKLAISQVCTGTLLSPKQAECLDAAAPIDGLKPFTYLCALLQVFEALSKRREEACDICHAEASNDKTSAL